MKQPELGIQIASLRVKNSMTQKELADLCNVDIRTIQRIEAGDVVPRMHTLRLLSTALGAELDHFNSNTENRSKLPGNIIRMAFIAGIVFLFSVIPVIYYLVTFSLPSLLYILSVSVYIISYIYFLRGFYFLGKHFNNKIMIVTSLITIVLVPLINVLNLARYYEPFRTSISLSTNIFTLVCINGIIFGIGLIMHGISTRSSRINLYMAAGILTIIQTIFFLTMDMSSAAIGLVISIGTDILMTIILYREYKSPAKENINHSSSTLAW